MRASAKWCAAQPQATRPCTASTPASASSPPPAFPRPTWSACSSICCARTPSAWASRLPPRVVRLVLLLKAASLARGFSGAREEVVDALLELHNRDVLPVVPCQGSVGASGDLAPLAHLCLPLIGEGEVFHGGRRMPAAQALERAGMRPLQLAAKEGLALINGTQVSTALALDALLGAERLFEAAVIAGALTLDAARGSDGPFDPRIHAVRGQPGQIAVRRRPIARCWRAARSGSSHLKNDDRVQDPYCLRCQPQVMGACLDQIRCAAQVLLREANAVTDNPLVFADTGRDRLRRKLPRGAGGARRRRAGPRHRRDRRDQPSGAWRCWWTPWCRACRRFSRRSPGLNSGFMIVHVTAAALASENKSLAHPASVDSLPTSANQEDHVSMATFAARRLQPMLRNTGAHRRHRAAGGGPGHRIPAAAAQRARARRGAAPGAQPLAGDDAGPQPGVRHRGGLPPGGSRRSRPPRAPGPAVARRAAAVFGPVGQPRPRGAGAMSTSSALFARHALLPSGWARDVLLQWDAAGSLCAVVPGSQRPAGIQEAAGPGAAGHAQPALARFPARLRRPHGISRAGAGQLLELANADVPLRRGDHAGPARGHRDRSVRGNAGGRLHQRVRVPLPASRRARPSLRRRRRALAAAPASCRPRGHRLDAIAGAVPGQRLRRHATARGPAALHPQHRLHAAPAGAAAAPMSGARSAPGPGAAFTASRAAGEPGANAWPA